MARYPAVVWNAEMDSALRETYQARQRGGVRKLADQLGISESSVTYRAKQLGVLIHSANPRIIWTAAIDAEIERVYRSGKSGGNKALTYKLGLSPGLISARAAKLGLPSLSPKGCKSSDWSELEKSMVRRHLGESIAQIRARLYRAGYSRSLHAVKHLISRQRVLGNWPTLSDYTIDRDQLLLPDVACGLGIKDHKLDYWIEKYGLKTIRYGGNKNRAIPISILKEWLVEHAGMWDHRKADHFFLLDVLTYFKNGKSGFSLSGKLAE